MMGRRSQNQAGIIIGAAILGLAAWTSSAAAAEPKAKTYWVYFGLYTSPQAKGILVSQFDAETGALSKPELAAELPNPSFLAVHPQGGYLYAASEIGEFQGKKSGAVAALALDAKTGKLKLLNQQASEGDGPCHVSVHPAGSHVLVANYGGGSVAALPIAEDGSLKPASSAIQHKGSGADPGRQQAPHAHSINVDPTGQFAFAADLGLDAVLIYAFDYNTGKLTPADPPAAKTAPGSGPRHFCFHPSGKFAYVINELNSTVTAFTHAAPGQLKEIQTLSTLTEPVKGNSTAEIVAHPSGNFIYGSNRGHNSLAIYSVDKATGKLTLVGHQATGGRTPRNFAIDPTGNWLLAENQSTNDVFVFKIDTGTGKLKQVGEAVAVPSPVCARFVPVAK